MELLVALIPLLPLAGFLFAVLVGPRLDRVPVHGHGHGHDEDATTDHATEDHATEAAHGDHDDHASVDDSQFRTVPSEAEQAETSRGCVIRGAEAGGRGRSHRCR